MTADAWEIVLAGTLAVNAALGFGYRVYRLSKGGPMADVIGQAILGVGLLAVAGAVATGAGWARWPSLVYAVLFGVIVMPIWVLAVLIPLRPQAVDYAFTVAYWLGLVGIAVAAIAL